MDGLSGSCNLVGAGTLFCFASIVSDFISPADGNRGGKTKQETKKGSTAIAVDP